MQLQLRIAFGIATILALPFALGGLDAPRSAPSMPAPSAAPSTHLRTSVGSVDAWLEFARTFAAALLGAAAAFGFNMELQRRQRRRENLAAGNLALLLLSRQLGDLLVFNKAAADHRAIVVQRDAATPIWAQLQPNHYYFSEGLKFDLESLSFLLSEGTASVLSRLSHAELLYFDFASIVERHAKVLEAVQTRIAEQHAENDSWATMELKVGIALIAQASSFASGIFGRLERSPDDIRTAITETRAALVERFGDEHVVRVKTDPAVIKLAELAPR